MTTTGTDNANIKTEPLSSHMEMVKVCVVQLNKVSRFLADLPDDAVAELLICPHTTAQIFNREIGTFNEDSESIRRIVDTHNIQYEGKLLQGMQIYDRPENEKKITYEQAWANQVRAAWEKAVTSGKTVTTGLAIGTRPMLCGKNEHGKKVLDDNLQTHITHVNEAILEQGGQEIYAGESHQIDKKHCSRDWNLTSTEAHGRLHRKQVFSVYMSDEWHYWDHKNKGRATSHPMALNIMPGAA